MEVKKTDIPSGFFKEVAKVAGVSKQVVYAYIRRNKQPKTLRSRELKEKIMKAAKEVWQNYKISEVSPKEEFVIKD